MRKLTSQIDKYIIMIQEIWIDSDLYFKNYWKGQYIFSPGTGTSRGCLTLLSNSKIMNINQLPDHRGHIAKILLDNEEFNIANVYAPVGFGEYKGEFLSDIFDKLYDKPNAIIAGDLNITFRDNERLGMSRPKAEKDMASYLNIKIDEQGWNDNWILDEPMMTWRRGDKQLVLDRVLFNFVPDEIKSVTDWKLNLSELTIIIYTFLDLNIEFVKSIFYLKTQRLQSCHLMPHLVSGLTRTSSHKTLACLNSSINISLNIFNSTWHLSN